MQTGMSIDAHAGTGTGSGSISQDSVCDIEDLMVNLKSISSVRVDEKLCTTRDGRYLVRDERFFQFVIRHLTGDCRTRIMDFIEKVLSDLNTHLERADGDKWERTRLVRLLPSVLVGLENIKTTYRADKVILFRLENLIDSLRHALKKSWSR
jgi:hypothetical protein